RERRVPRQEVRRILIRHSRLHERRRHHPEEREQRDERAEDERRVQRERRDAHAAARGNSGDGARHARRRSRRNWSTVQARMITNSTNAIAAALPNRHQRKPSVYMKSTRLVVLLSGPPCVITYGSANNWK